MVRVTEKQKEAARKKLSEGEPSFTCLNSDIADLVKALNYYAVRNNAEDSKRFAVEWATANCSGLTSQLIRANPLDFQNTGFLCRILDNGFCDDELQTRVINELNVIAKNVEQEKEQAKEEAKTKLKPFKRQDPNQVLEQFDYALDAISTGQTPDKISYGDNRKHLAEVEAAATKLQTEIFEFPEQFFNVKELKKFVKEVIEKTKTVAQSVKAAGTRKVKPRKVDPIKMVAQLNLGASDDELNVKTLKATSIIGATKLIVWHPERRTLTSFIAVNENGFLVSGRSLKNFDTVKSITKKIRKPADMWKEINSMTATKMHIWLRDTCKTTATPAKALIADGSIIFKV